MSTIKYFFIALSSCVFWGVIGVIGFFATTDGDWKHTAFALLLLLDAFIAVEFTIMFSICLIRKKMGYKVPEIGE